MRLRDVDSPTARLQAVAALVFCVVLPAGSIVQGSRIFAWNMFSQSASYRLSIQGTFPDGAERQVDPRILSRHVNAELAYFLPPPSVWRFDPVGPTFRSGLAGIAAFACRAGTGATNVVVTLEERADLDAPVRTTRVTTGCR